MGVRITTAMLFNTNRFNLQRALGSVARLQDVLANGGKELLRPSDDPEGVATALRLRGTRTELERFSTNIDRVRPFVAESESSLGDIGSNLINLREIAISGADDVVDSVGRASLAQQVSGLLQDAVNSANADFSGRRLFGGTETRVAPFTLEGNSVVFNGNEDPIFEEISAGNVVQINTIGNEAFSGFQGSFTSRFDLNPGIADGSGGFDTPLAFLNNGAGVAPGSITITDRSGNPPAVIAIGAGDTIGDVLAAINAAGIDVNASIAVSNDSILIEDTSATPIGDLTITGTGTTASDLGIEETAGVSGSKFGTDLDPILTLSNAQVTTALGDLNAGAGIDFADFTIQDKDGTIATVDLSGLTPADTVNDVIAAINGAGTNVVASLAADGSGLILTDTTSTGRNELRITEGSGSTAQDLGILDVVSGTQLIGTRLNPAPDPADLGTLSTPLSLLDSGNGVFPDSLRVTVGAQSAIVDLSTATTLGDVAAAIEGTGFGLSVDLDAQNRRLIVTSIDPTAPVSIADGGQIGDARSFGLNAFSLFDTIIAVQTALQNDDPDTLTRLVDDIDAHIDKLSTTRAISGGRLRQFDSVQNSVETQRVDVETLISQTEDADISDVITRLFQAENTLTAALGTAGRVLPQTLLDFLA